VTITCATCHRALDPALARLTAEGFVHVKCPRIPPHPETLPYEPLEPYYPRVTAWPSSNRLRDAVEKARSRGRISVRTADRAAIALGLHPALIWGDAWWVPVTEEAA
jgi:hypothetical protein